MKIDRGIVESAFSGSRRFTTCIYGLDGLRKFKVNDIPKSE